MRFSLGFLALLISTSGLIAQSSCMEFTGLSGIYGPSGPNGSPAWYEVFHTEGNIELAAQGFVDSTGNVNGSAYISVTTNQFSGAFTLANGVYAKTAPTSAMIFTFPVSDTVTFNYIDWNSTLNFAVNNEAVVVVSDFSDLPAAVAPGVTMSINSTVVGGGTQGTITLIGYIHKVIVGGDNMGLDNFCQKSSTTQPCLINELSVTAQPCSNGSFMSTIDLVYTDTGSLGFTVMANTTNFGTYYYNQLPVTVGPLSGDGSTNWNFTVTDVENNFCTAYDNIGIITCPVCSVTDIIAEPLACASDSTYTAYIEFIPTNNSSSNFDLTVDGEFIATLDVNSLPWLIDLPSTPSGTQLITICESGTSCCGEQVIAALDCSPSPVCAMTNFTATTNTCSSGLFDVVINFTVNDPAGTTFTLSGNGTTYGSYNYTSLPITLTGFQGDNATTYSFLVVDDADANCSADGSVGPVDCPLPCVYNAITADSLVCTSDSTYKVLINIDYSGTTGSSFDLTLGSQLIGNFAYSQLPLWVEDLAGDGQVITGYACDSNPTIGCCVDFFFTALDCMPPPVCEIGNLVVDVQPCDDFGKYTAILDFDYNNTTTHFTVFANGINFGVFSYANLPVTIGAFNGNGTNYDIEVVDNDGNGTCQSSYFLQGIDCPVACAISAVETQALVCTSDTTYSLYLNFNHSGQISNQFKVSASSGQVVGYYAYTELPLTINHFPANGATPETVSVSDVANPTCAASATFTPLSCVLPCEITAMSAVPSDCDANNMFTVTIDLTYTEPGTGFNLTGNGTNYGTYAYVDLPVTLGPFAGDGVTSYEFFVEDTDNPNCANSATVGIVSCVPPPCEIGQLIFDPLQCTSDSTYTAIIDFEIANPAAATFSVTDMNGNILGIYDYASLPVTTELYSLGNATETITVCDTESPNCCASLTFDAPDCNTSMPCNLSNLTATVQPCDTTSGLFMVELNFSASNTSPFFNVMVNGGSNGSFEYANLPVLIGPFFGDGVTFYNITVADAGSPNCIEEAVVTPVSCLSQPCELSNLTATAIECTSATTIALTIDFDYVNTIGGFDVFSATGYVGFYEYADLPLTITDYPIIGDAIESIIICDANNSNCCTEVNFESLDCMGSVCELGVMSVEVLPCNPNGNVNVLLDFDYVNTSDSFMLVGNGVNYGTYSYANLPVTVGSFVGDEVSIYELQAVDLENPDCTTFTSFGPVDCIFVCELTNLAAEPVLCTSDSTYTLQLQFNYEDVSTNGFNVFAQGVVIGNYSYSELPLEIEDFPVMSSNIIQLSVCDADNLNCCASIIYEAPDCSGGCNIYEVNVEPFDCDNGEFAVLLNLDYVNPGPLGFQVFGNGMNYGNYSYSDLPISIDGFNGDGITAYEFIVVDLVNTDCINFTEIDPYDCTVDCVMSNLEVSPECAGDEFVFNLDFDYNNGSTAGFTVNGNGVIYGTFNYADLPIVLGPFTQGDSTNFEFVITDMTNDNCNSFIVYGEVDCTLSGTENVLEKKVELLYDFVGKQVLVSLNQVLDADANIEIYNVAGTRVYATQLEPGISNTVITTAGFVSGWYVVRVSSSEGQMSLPFIVAR